MINLVCLIRYEYLCYIARDAPPPQNTRAQKFAHTITFLA